MRESVGRGIGRNKMIRQLDMNEISDGRLYRADDMVKAGCGGCEGCSLCCRGMGTSIVLDPYDIYSLEKGLHTGFKGLLEERIELNAVDGIILPNMKLSGADESCGFLNAEGRCDIHGFRPGICRLFPLGRIFEDGGHMFFTQVNECPKRLKTKVKVKNWLDIPDFSAYDRYTDDWHYFVKDVVGFVSGCEDVQTVNIVCTVLLKIFYFDDYRTEDDFYGQFYDRLAKVKKYM